MGAERLGERGRVRIAAGLATGNRFNELGTAWTAKELVRGEYARPTCSLPGGRTCAAAEPRIRTAVTPAMEAFYVWCTDVQVSEVSRLAKTCGPTEAVNPLIEKVSSFGHGFCNFDNYQLRLLLRCGVTWQARAAARIRGCQPRLVA